LPHAISDVGSRPTISRKLLTESYLSGWAGWLVVQNVAAQMIAL